MRVLLALIRARWPGLRVAAVAADRVTGRSVHRRSVHPAAVPVVRDGAVTPVSGGVCSSMQRLRYWTVRLPRYRDHASGWPGVGDGVNFDNLSGDEDGALIEPGLGTGSRDGERDQRRRIQ